MQKKNRNGLAGWRKKRTLSDTADTASAAASRGSAASSLPLEGEVSPKVTERSTASTASTSPASDLERLYSAILNRESFNYDVTSDPAYQQYRDSYTAAGKRAMSDAEASSAALTGGYGSTYSAAAGQQEYDEYMKKLADVIPELEAAAYSRYTAEGDALLDRYGIAKAAEQTEYDRAEDAYARQLAERDYADKLAAAEAERELAAAEDAYTRQKDERTMLTALIGKGYSPTDSELSAAGMTRAQANSLLYEYYRSSKQSAPAWLTEALGIAPAATATASTSSATAETASSVKKKVSRMKEAGVAAEAINNYIVSKTADGVLTGADARRLLVVLKA